MKHLSHKEFEQRWNAARVRPELKAKPAAAARTPRIELSLATILDNYESGFSRHCRPMPLVVPTAMAFAKTSLH